LIYRDMELDIWAYR